MKGVSQLLFLGKTILNPEASGRWEAPRSLSGIPTWNKGPSRTPAHVFEGRNFQMACLRDRNSLLAFSLGFAKRMKLIPHMEFLKNSALEKEFSDAGLQIRKAMSISKTPERFIVAIR